MNMKQIRILLVIAIISTFSYESYSQKWDWGLKATGVSQSPYEPSTEINVDYDGNVVIAGHFKQNIAFDTLSIYTEDNDSDIFLCRINSKQQVEWLKHIKAGTYGDEIGLTVDDDKNIYLTGSVDGKVFVSKYDSLGNQIWNQDFNQEHQGYGQAISIDQFDNVYVSGGSGWTFFMAKLDFHGNPIWEKDIWMNYSSACNITDLAVDALGNIYFIGVFGIETLKLGDFVLEHDGGWGDDTFFGRLDPNGNFIWIKSSSGRTSSTPQIALTADNQLFLSGAFYEEITFNNLKINGVCCQYASPYIAKYNTDGAIIWVRPGFTTHLGQGVTHDIKVDYNGSLYLTGTYFTCSGSGCTESDFYLEKYNSSGEHLWRKEQKMATRDYSHSIDIDNNGHLYNIGYNQSANFIDENEYSNTTYTVGVGRLDTESPTPKRTPRPLINRFVQVCDRNTPVTLEAKGENIKWYTDPTITNQISSGNTFKPSFTSTDTLYVTQTLNEIDSWPKQVIFYISDLPEKSLTLKNDTLSAPGNIKFTYQWLYNGDSLANASSNFIVVDSTQSADLFSVIVSEFNCSKILDQVEVITSLEDIYKEEKISFYPNPTHGKVQLKLNSSIRNDLLVRVFNINGKEVISKLLNNSDIGFIDLSQHPNGMYLIVISNNQVSESFKIVKH